jgi:hypothetical protein
MAELVINLIYISLILGVYIKALYDIVNVSKLALNLIKNYCYNTL